MREQKLLERVLFLVNDYRPKQPLSVFLRQYFRSHRNMGSRDRRETREWVYHYHRIGNCLSYLPITERLALAVYLCSGHTYPSLYYLLSKFSAFSNVEINLPLDAKLDYLKSAYPEFDLQDLFPAYSQLTGQLDRNSFLKTHFVQPELFIRIKRDHINEVIAELKKKEIAFSRIEDRENILVLQNSASIDGLESFEKGFFEIQDLNSAATGDYFLPASGSNWWDVCAGSGGKSLLLYDLEPSVRITASDVRPAILKNLRIRFERNKIQRYSCMDFEAAAKSTEFSFDGIITDVPCSGSGTWSRNPEWLRYFEPALIQNHYVPLQRKIVEAALKRLKPGSPLIYISCSVFAAENEENIIHFEKQFSLKSESISYLAGASRKADTLFVARLIK